MLSLSPHSRCIRKELTLPFSDQKSDSSKFIDFPKAMSGGTGITPMVATPKAMLSLVPVYWGSPWA